MRVVDPKAGYCQMQTARRYDGTTLSDVRAPLGRLAVAPKPRRMPRFP